jgi:L-cysteine S-thiosulfotransferase
MASAKREVGATRAVAAWRWLWLAPIAGMAGLAAPAADCEPGAALEFVVVGDTIPAPLGAAKGDAARGRALIVARDAANCVLCHAVTDPAVRYSGNVGPSLDGVARRLSVPQLRLRIADNLRVNPASIMPSYYRIEGLDRVASAYSGKPILDAGQVEDIVAYLATLQ